MPLSERPYEASWNAVYNTPEQLAAMMQAGATLLLQKDMAWEQLHSVITLAVPRQCAAFN